MTAAAVECVTAAARRPNIKMRGTQTSRTDDLHKDPGYSHPNTPQTRDIEPLLDQCWSTIYTAGPALKQQ